MKNIACLLFDRVLAQVKSLEFIRKHKTAPQYFTRRSPLGFFKTALIVINMVKKASKVEIMSFFNQYNKEFHEELLSPSRQALSQAREKISYSAFKDFFEQSCEMAVNAEDARLYKGYRLWAFDGTSFIVGPMGKLHEFFGKSTTTEGNAMCRINAVVDVLCDCIVDAVVAPFATGERALALEQLRKLSAVSNALLLFDRGYWSPELVNMIIRHGQKFLMRIASTNVKAVARGFDLRLFSFTLPSGEKEFLLTNLSPDEVSDDELSGLYTKRWGIETKYLELKSRLELDRFSGESQNIVLQDIYSALFISNLLAFICYDTDEMINEQIADRDLRYDQKTNRAEALALLRMRFIELCLMDSAYRREHAWKRLYQDLCRCKTSVKKSKPCPRNKHLLKNNRKSYSKSFL